jgi:hypothetical protein
VESFGCSGRLREQEHCRLLGARKVTRPPTHPGEQQCAVTESVDGSHVAFIAQPDVAAGLILKALASV